MSTEEWIPPEVEIIETAERAAYEMLATILVLNRLDSERDAQQKLEAWRNIRVSATELLRGIDEVLGNNHTT